MTMVRLIYVSRYWIDPAEAPMTGQLNDILSSATRNNERDGITGALVFDSRHFIQALEGELDAVWATFKRLEGDPRHDAVRFVEMLAVPERAFPQWWMGCAERCAGNEAVFRRYQHGGAFDPPSMSARALEAFLRELAAVGLEQRFASVSA